MESAAVEIIGRARPCSALSVVEANPLGRRGLRPASALAAERPHGDRLKYMGGCRCSECRAANTRYERERAAARLAGDWNGLVSADRARAHLRELSKRGVGRHSVQDVAGISGTVLTGITSGTKQSIRARTERLILRVTAEAAADGALTSAKATWRRLDGLVKDGYSRAELARRLGYARPALQIGRSQVTVRTAYRVERLYEQLRLCSAARSLVLLEQLRAEGFRMAFIEEQLKELADLRGLPAPSLVVRNGRIHAWTAKLLKQLHARLLA